MSNTNILTQSRYSKLLKDIRTLIDEGRKRVTKASQEVLVEVYWNVGKRISEEGLIENAGYGDAILEDLSDELGMDLSTLHRCIHFFQTYNIAPRSKNLTWSHYKTLLPINDKPQRDWYANLTVDQNFTAPQLSKAIKEDRYGQSKNNKNGKVQTRTLKRPGEATYIYKAIVERVIDGDTLLLRIDLGFQVLKEQRVRLADIDTPSMDQPNGKEATKYVRDQLAKVDFIMIKTNKIDVYGRYVGHIFYSFKERDKGKIFTNGRYLNQELVNRGLAKVI